MIYQTIYRRLLRLIPALDTLYIGESATFKADGYMDLHVDVLTRAGPFLSIALAHRYTQNGDSMADPDMTIRVNLKSGMAEALTFQQDLPYSHRREVYGVNAAGQTTVRPKLKAELNSFLAQWLLNLHRQGHKLDQTKKAA
jgi:uncharacterized protein YqiB (DUF1249 family)